MMKFAASTRSALSLSASMLALALVSTEVRATDYTWTGLGGSTSFVATGNWNAVPTVFDNTNNFIINATPNNPFITTNFLSLGTITINGGTLTLNPNQTFTTTGMTINNGGTFVTALDTFNGNIIINAGGTYRLTGATTFNGNITNAGTLAAGDFFLATITTLTNTGTITGSSGIRATTINNSGTITGTTNGIDSGNSAITLTNSGTISGGTSAVLLRLAGNTININPGAVFTNGIDYSSTTGNMTKFGTGSYTIPVKSYNVAGNTITVANPATQSIVTSSIANTSGNGNIAIVSTAATTTATSSTTNQTQKVTRIASSVWQEMLNNTASLTGIYDFGGWHAQRDANGNLVYDAQGKLIWYYSSNNPTGNAGLVRNVRNEFGSEVTLPGELNTTADMGTPRQGVVADGQGNMFWSRAFAGTTYQPEASGLPATQSYLVGAVLGYDRRLEDWRIGGFAGYGSTALNSYGGAGNVKGDVFFAGLYGRRELGQWAFDLGLTGGTIGNKSSRFINGAGGLETANAAFNGVFIAPEAAVSYRHQIDPAWMLTPTARLRYTGSFYGGYAENGSSQNITFGAQSVHMIEERAELRLGHTMRLEEGLWFNSYVQASAFGIHRLGSDVATASVLGSDITLTSGTSKDTFGASLGVGFDWKMKKDMTLFAGADALIYSNGSNGANARAGIRINF